MKPTTESIRTHGFRRALIAGAFGAVALGAVAAPASADTLGYYYDAPPVVTPGPTTTTTTTTTYTYTESAPTYIEPAPILYEREHHHGAGIHLDTPILNFGIGVR